MCNFLALFYSDEIYKGPYPDQRLTGQRTMPYFVYKITSQEGMRLVKNLELLNEFEKFKDAKKYARDLRSTNKDEQVDIKVFFAENQLLAEEQLLEHREKPVTMEHEK